MAQCSKTNQCSMMKLICFIAICAVVAAQMSEDHDAERPGTRDDRCSFRNSDVPTFLPHESECHMFYMCNDGRKCKKCCEKLKIYLILKLKKTDILILDIFSDVFECPGDLLFDKELETCSYAETAVC